jgi:hypothetical protein
MFTARGVYQWELIDDKSGLIADQGIIENTITDGLLYGLNDGVILSPNSWSSGATTRIVLSTTATPLPAADYRRYGVAEAAISRTVVSANLTPYTYSDSLRNVVWQNNFAAPGATRTITIFGLDLTSDAGWRNFVSFVELTTPITQTTSQSLLVRYTIFTDFVSTGGLNGSYNSFIDAEVKKISWSNGLNRQSGMVIHVPRSTASNYCATTLFTPWAYTSADLSKVMAPPFMWKTVSQLQTIKETDEGTYHAIKFLLSLSTTDYYGPIGTVCFGRNLHDTYYHVRTKIAHSVSPCSSLSPAISRVFAHPESRKRNVIFSDVSYPPSSRGIITLSGTPTNKWPWLTGRIHITKTGDASDIVGGAISGTNGNDYITVTESGWAVDDQITLAGGSLPSPLTETTYWVVNVTGTDLKLSTTQGGAAITLTGDGTGTCTRYNTGKFRLEYNSMPTVHTTTDNPDAAAMFLQFQMVKDFEGNVYTSDVLNTLGEGTLVPYYTQMAVWRKGDYCYSIHQILSSATRYQFGKWRFASVETVQPICSLLKSTCTIYSVCRGSGTYADTIFLATSDGVYTWDLANPTVVPSKRTITGLISSTVWDVAYDAVRGYLWTGHSTGLSRVDLSTDIATTYTIAGGQLAGGLTSAQVACPPSSITVNDARLVRSFGTTSGGNPWVLDDDYDGGGSIGWYQLSSTENYDQGCALRHSKRLQIVQRWYTEWRLYSLVITGKGTGTLTTLHTLAATAAGGGSTNYTSLVRISDYSYFVLASNYFCSAFLSYTADQFEGKDDSTDINQGYQNYCTSTRAQIYTDKSLGLRSAAVDKSGIDIANGVMVKFINNQMISKSTRDPYAFDLHPFGWNGSAWELDNMTEYLIPSTATPTLFEGVSAQFQNNTGQPWDTQFISGERFTWMQAPVPVKDNLQTYTIKGRFYGCGVKRVVEWATTAAASVIIPECITGTSPDPDFRDLDTVDYITTVFDVTTATTLIRSLLSSPPDGSYYMTSAGEFKFHANQVGDSVKLTYNYTVF